LVLAPDDVPITVTFKASQINYIMNALALRPFNEVSEMITHLKNSGDEQIAAYRKAATDDKSE